MNEYLYVAELTAYDLVGEVTTTLRYATRGFVTTPSETPANTPFDGVIQQPLNVRRHAFRLGATSGQSEVGYGDLLLENGNGDLDALVTDYAFDGRAITMRRGLVGAAYPGGFTTVFVGTMEQAEVDRDVVKIRVKDKAFALDVPLQTTLYAGDNVLPDGLEGTADDLKGKRKPLVFGTAKNVAPPCVNTSKLIYQVSDGPVALVGAVYDAGIPLILTDWPAPTTVSAFSGGQISGRLYSPRLGLYVVVGYTTASAPVLATSPDFVNWTTRTTGFTLPIIKVAERLAPDGTPLLVAVGAGGEVESSPDGVTWTTQTFGAAIDLFALTYGATLFVAAGGSGGLRTSPDGVTWTSRTSGFGATTIRALRYADGLFVAVGDSGKLATSEDAITWTIRTSGFGSTAIRDVGFLNIPGTGARWIAVGDTGVRSVSNDAVTWTTRQAPSATQLTDVAGTGTVFYAGGVLGKLAVSIGGSDWVDITSGFGTSNITTAFTGQGYVILAGQVGKISRDPGIEVYASEADLLDDTLAPIPGSAKAYLAGGYIRLGSTPYGQITCDVTQGASAADRTAGSLFENILTKAGYSSADWVTGDVTTLDAADNSVLGLWCYEDEMTVAEAIDLVAATVGAWWGPRASDGLFRIVQLLAPSSPSIEFVASDLAEPLRMLPTTDEGRGLPSTKTTIRYGRNWTVQNDGLALGVSEARRAYLASPWREVFDEDSAVADAYLLARSTVEDSLYDVEADAQAEADRRQALRGVRRRRFTAVAELNDDTDGLDLGDVASLTHERFGLSGGADFRVLGIEPNARDGRVSLTLWG